MHRYIKGAVFERKIVHDLVDMGAILAIRGAGSKSFGSIKADIMALFPSGYLIIIQAKNSSSKFKKEQEEFKNPEEPMFTLTGQDIHGVAIFDYRSDEGIRIRKNNMSPALTSHGNSAGGVPIPMIQKDTKIRRLTPIECERLMSWSSNWTRWGIDEKGNKVEISDTQRYKMAGNGVVSNVVKWIIENVILNGR